MDWFETAMESELFSEPEGNGERYLLMCLLADKRSGECRINEFLYQLQDQLNRISSEGNVLFHKAFVYGDGRVCIRDFSETEEQEIYYADACSEPVPDSHLLIIADRAAERFLADRPSAAASFLLLIIRESEYGTERASELTLRNYYSDKKVGYHLAFAGSRIQGDWLEQFVKKQEGKVFSFEETEKLINYIRS
ncbi:MAG: hypothetical protein SO101_09415 [Lachnospiraceae bacterium]|nr:hypothetical protein [Lachnospiraceae bacterium]